ncbi:MAG: hypothetical protein JJT85_08890 [Chromatiales bacterium]|nr:hypothetical protein [Chromatiales bacterium]
MEASATMSRASDDPGRFFWYGVYVLIMAVSALPLFGFYLPVQLPEGRGAYVTTLVIHELAAFLFFGHTVFSNIWAMRLRLTQGPEIGVWARGFLRKLALGITFPTSVIIPLSGLLLIDRGFGGLSNTPWAWDAYLAFWVMAGVSLVPDIIRYGRNRNAGDARHGVVSGAVRGMIALVLTLYIILCMVAKISIFAS